MTTILDPAEKPEAGEGMTRPPDGIKSETAARRHRFQSSLNKRDRNCGGKKEPVACNHN